MQFKVPQNIQMEDKIIGPLTMKQFVYLLVGGMVSYATIKTYNPAMIIFVGIPVAILALCLAFIKIQDQPFSKFLFSFAQYMLKPKQRVWQKDKEIFHSQKPIIQNTKKKDDKKSAPKEVEKSELEKLSYILDTRGHEKAMEEQKIAGAPEVDLKNYKKEIKKDKSETTIPVKFNKTQKKENNKYKK